MKITRQVALTFAVIGLFAAQADAATTNYQYDALGRLVGVTRSDGSSVTYAYDVAGNRTQVVSGGPVTNLLQSTEQIVAPPWYSYYAGTGGGPSVTLNAAQAPDANVTADLVSFSRSDTSSTSMIYFSQGSSGSVTARTSSIYLKAYGSGDVGKILHAWQWNGSAVDVATITLTSQWQRIILPATTPTDGARPLDLGLLGDSYGTTGSSTGQINVLVWGAQSEIGTSAGAYTPVP